MPVLIPVQKTGMLSADPIESAALLRICSPEQKLT
jgi:hypothetical protein